MAETIKIDRAPVLTVWAAVVAERLGLDWDEGAYASRAMAALNAYSKGMSLDLYEPTPEAVRERGREACGAATVPVALLHPAAPPVEMTGGLRGLSKDRPITPGSSPRHLKGKFGERLPLSAVSSDRIADSLRGKGAIGINPLQPV